MYMFVLVTLIVALIGIYTQVFNVQQSHMAAQETGIAQAMLDWHATAVGLAQNTVKGASVPDVAAIPFGGCSLTEGFASAGEPPYCANGGLTVYISPTAGTSPAAMTACSGTPAVPCRATLPTSYGGLSKMKFYSVAYQATISATSAYVLTFVPSPTVVSNGMPSFLCLPGVLPLIAATSGANCGTTIDAGMNDLMAQIKHRGTSMFGYGTVASCPGGASLTCPTGMQLVTPPVPNSSNVMTPALYPVPAYVPVGAAGVISQVNLCSGC